MILRWIDFLTSDGEKGYRNRDEEFIDDISSKSELTIVWEKGWKTLIDIYSRKKLFSWNILTDASEFILGIPRRGIFIYFHNFCHQLFLVRDDLRSFY